MARPLGLSVAVAVLGLACSIDRSGLRDPSADGGPDATMDASRDGAPMDAPSDGSTDAPDDADVPSCPDWGWPRPRVVLAGGEAGKGLLDPDATHETTVVEEGRLMLPLARYRWGALVFAGFAESGLFGDPPAWSDVDSATPEGRAFMGDLQQFHSGSDVPPGLLIDGQDTFTVSAHGEIHLEAGMREIELTVDDEGLLEVDLDPGAGMDVRRVIADSPGISERVTFEVSAEGWYPIRIAYADIGIDSLLEVREGPEGGPLEIVGSNRLRTRADMLEGRESMGFADRVLTPTPSGRRIDPDPTDVDYGNIALPGLSLGDKDDFIVRWQGRLRFDRAIARLRADTDESHRVWVDGVYLGGEYDGGTIDRRYPFALEPGWHDTVIELGDGGGGTAQHVYWAGDRFEPADMHPHLRFGGLAFGRGTNERFDVDAASSEMRSLEVAAPAETPTAVELSAVVETDDPSSVSVTFQQDGEAPLDLPGEPRPLPFVRGFVWHRTVSASELGGSANGTWTVTIDNAGDEAVTVRAAGVLAHVGGEEQPYPASETFVSAPLELGEPVRVTRIEALGRVPDGTAVDLAVRVAETRAGLADATWEDADAEGAIVAGSRGQWAQIRAVLRGGVDTPRIRELRLRASSCLCALGTAPEDCMPSRDDPALVALYTFEDGSGETVTDSVTADPMDLTIGDTSLVTWGPDTLTIDEPTDVFADDATKLAGSVTDEVTIEAWVRPASRTVVGDLPKRVVTFSKDANDRNFTLGQAERWRWGLRLRTDDDATSSNGYPEAFTPAGSVRTELVHVVATHSAEAGGTTRIYLDGRLVHESERPGALTNWDPSYEFGLANEADDGRAWLGTYHRVALYSRALDASEVRARTDLGP